MSESKEKESENESENKEEESENKESGSENKEDESENKEEESENKEEESENKENESENKENETESETNDSEPILSDTKVSETVLSESDSDEVHWVGGLVAGVAGDERPNFSEKLTAMMGDVDSGILGELREEANQPMSARVKLSEVVRRYYDKMLYGLEMTRFIGSLIERPECWLPLPVEPEQIEQFDEE